jgi:hypothetical protein
VRLSQTKTNSQVPVAHGCNPSYSGGRDQEDHGLTLAWVNSSEGPYLEKAFTKIGLVEWLKVMTPSSNPVLQKQTNKTNQTKQGVAN